MSDRDLDIRFAEKVLGWENFRTTADGVLKGRPPHRGKGIRVPYFREDIAEVMWGVDYINMDFALTYFKSQGLWQARFTEMDGDSFEIDHVFIHKSRATAIMMACLKVKGDSVFVAGYMAGLKI